MKFENLDSEEKTISEAMAEVSGIKNEIMSMGANDSENSAIDEIVYSLEKKEIRPKEAVARAREILESKQDYH